MDDNLTPLPHPRVGQGWWEEFLRMVADWPGDDLEEAIQEITNFLDHHPEVHLVGNDEGDFGPLPPTPGP